MKTPKLLPWYARRAGISNERATTLWRKAVREATVNTGWVGNEDYWSESMRCFLVLLEREKSTFCAPSMSTMVRTQNRIWRLPFDAMENVYFAMSANWQRQCSVPRKAA